MHKLKRPIGYKIGKAVPNIRHTKNVLSIEA
jgi:hypothetical protein